MLALKASVYFTAPLSLQEVAALISSHLFGGLAFLETGAFDEEPAVWIERGVLGFAPVLYGNRPGFGLSFMTTPPVCEPEKFPQLELISITKYMEERLSLIEGIMVIPS